MNGLIDKINQLNDKDNQYYLLNSKEDQIYKRNEFNNHLDKVSKLSKLSKLNRLINKKFKKKIKKNQSNNIQSNKLTTNNLDEMFEIDKTNFNNLIDLDQNLMNLNKVNQLKIENNQLKENLNSNEINNCDDKMVKCENQILNQSIDGNLLNLESDNYYFVDKDNDENYFNNEFNLINNLECNLSNSSEDKSCCTSIEDEIFNHNNQLNCTLNEQTNYIDNYINNDLNNFNDHNSNIDTTYSINNEHLEKTTNCESKNNDAKLDNLELNKCSDYMNVDNLQLNENILNENILNVIISNNQFNSQTNLDRKIGSLSLNSIKNNLIIKQPNKHLLNNNLDDNKIKLNNNQQNNLDNYFIFYNNDNQIMSTNKKKISNNEQIFQLKNSIDSSNCLNSLYSLANNLDLNCNLNQSQTADQSSKKIITNKLNQNKSNQINKNSSSLNPFSLECRIPLPGTLTNDHNIFIDNKNFIKRRNQRERIRVKEINERFEKLRKHLPIDYEQFIDPNSLSTNSNNSINSTDLKFRNSNTFYMPNLNGNNNEINNLNNSNSSNKERRLSKVETLRLAICYIKHLQNILNSSS